MIVTGSYLEEVTINGKYSENLNWQREKKQQMLGIASHSELVNNEHNILPITCCLGKKVNRKSAQFPNRPGGYSQHVFPKE